MVYLPSASLTLHTAITALSTHSLFSIFLFCSDSQSQKVKFYVLPLHDQWFAFYVTQGFIGDHRPKNNSYHLLRTYYVVSTMLHIVNTLFHLILTVYMCLSLVLFLFQRWKKLSCRASSWSKSYQVMGFLFFLSLLYTPLLSLLKARALFLQMLRWWKISQLRRCILKIEKENIMKTL